MPFGTGGPAQKTGIYESADGSLRIRFDAVQRGNRVIEQTDLERGLLAFDADRIIFVAFVQRGDLNPTRCLRFVQVKRGTITLTDRVRVRQLGINQPNPLRADWGIDDIGGDGQLNTRNRRDGSVSASTCDRPSSNGAFPYEISADYNVEFILYVVNCCARQPNEERRAGQKKKKGAASANRPQVMFALPWSIKIHGRVPFGGQPAEASYAQVMSDVQVAPPDGTLVPVIPAVVRPPICRPIRPRTGDSTCV
jgi:hypothetical protein